MGGCASKPKELKAELAAAPAPEPAPAKEEALGTVVEAKEIPNEELVKVDEKTGEEHDDIVEGETIVEETGDKRRSLSNLFKQNEEGQESVEKEKTLVESVKQESPRTTAAEAETKTQEAEKPRSLAEQAPAPAPAAVVDAVPEKSDEVAKIIGTDKTEDAATLEEKKSEEKKPEAIEINKTETSVVEKKDENK